MSHLSEDYLRQILEILYEWNAILKLAAFAGAVYVLSTWVYGWFK